MPEPTRASSEPPFPHIPVIFVHGNGDTAALWHTTIWRFESNGWPRELLFALDIPYPLARDDDDIEQPGRSSSDDQMAFLSQQVDHVLKVTQADKVVLFAHSRGGFSVRNYIANDGGAAKVSHAILGGTPNHGVWADSQMLPGNEFNGGGPFLRSLNAPQGRNGQEVTPVVKWLTLRSDHNDKFAQPDGLWMGAPGLDTHVSFNSPALHGAENVVLLGADHRETSFSPQAFLHAFRFITGRAPATLTITPESFIVLNGKVSGLGVDNTDGNEPSNLPLAGATVEVYATIPGSGERSGPPVHRKIVAADGMWGPFEASGMTHYEFVINANWYGTTHIYRSPFVRSSSIVHLRAGRLPNTEMGALSIVTLSRPRGYFDLANDHVSLDGTTRPADIPPGTAGVSVASVRIFDCVGRAVTGEFNGERIVGRAWPTADNHVVVLELHY